MSDKTCLTATAISRSMGEYSTWFTATMTELLKDFDRAVITAYTDHVHKLMKDYEHEEI